MRRSGGPEISLVAALIAAGLASLAFSTASSAEPLSFEDRVRCQRRIDEVYWRHRTWPAENPGPKPALGELVSETRIRERVATYLEKSAALEVLWARSLSGEQLQAEMNRMTRNTRKPELLRDLFAALDHDPFLVAECLARPVLVSRLTGNCYARDARFHGALREEAEAALATYPDGTKPLATIGETYAETEWRLLEEDEQGFAAEMQHTDHRVNHLTREEWSAALARFADIPPGGLSALREEHDRFATTTVLAREPDVLRTGTVTWNKRPFDRWWAEEGRAAVESADVTHVVRPPAGGYELRFPLDDGCTADTWTEIWNVPTSRVSHAAVWTGAEMIVWGGFEDRGGIFGAYLNTGGRYDPATDSWTPTSIGAGVPPGRPQHTAVWTGTEMIVWGGVSQMTGGRYNPTTDSWAPTSTGSGVPSARIRHTAVWTGTEMIVWGGQGDGYLNSGGRYDPATDSWKPTSTGSFVPWSRAEHTAVWTGSEMIIWGGSAVVGNSGGRYDPVTDSWTPTSTGPFVPSKRSGHTAVWTGTEMIVWGGSFSGHLDTGGRYDPVTDSWTATSTGAGVPAERTYHTAVWTGTEMIVWGGVAYGFLNSGGRYDPALDSWAGTSTANGVPTGRAYHTALWTGSEMIVWGGGISTWVSTFIETNTGGRYDPSTDTWTATSLGNGVPAAREEHNTVWTGAEMIVWGGHHGGYLNTGGRYDPALDNWTETSTADGVPVGRSGDTAIWTGTEMIVWGGYDSDALNSGGRYDPTTDGWSAISTAAGVPVERWDHTAVWTGTEMIVWGGYNGDEYLNSGGRYNPATGAWTEISMAGAPSGRSSPSTTWTGAEMIVWGGYNGDEYLNSGGRYNPATGAWTETSMTGAPSGRSFASTVWTGTELIVWGGYLDRALNSGGRYDPAADRWLATSTATNVPVARWNHTAVWTGAEMIVWGGRRSHQPLRSGSRYDPATDGWIATSTSPGVATVRWKHSAVWTGTEMIVWGGSNDTEYLNSGGRYCACEGSTVSFWYTDADGDGYGAESAGIPACAQPPGYIADGGDCNDGLATCITDCTTDLDADGIADCADTCVDLDGDTYGEPGGAGYSCQGTDCDDTVATCNSDCVTDEDEDLVPDCRDNCPGTYNPSQFDADLDGWAEGEGCDCDDADPTTYPGAPEVNDGRDNQCPGDDGHGIVDELSGLCGFQDPADVDVLSWPAQSGATSYGIARSTSPRFNAACFVTGRFVTFWRDTDPVTPGGCHYYLVRAGSPNLGSWGAGSSGSERHCQVSVVGAQGGR